MPSFNNTNPIKEENKQEIKEKKEEGKKEEEKKKRGRKVLSDAEIKGMKPDGDFPLISDIGENTGLRVKCGASGTKTFFYRYSSPITGKLIQIKIGIYPIVGLAEARVQLRDMKAIRKSGRCPATERREEEERLKQEMVEAESKGNNSFTIKDLIELYLTQRIEDRIVDGKRIPGARKRKGQDEVRRTLYGDAIPALGNKQAADVTRKEITEMVNKIVGRGANVQAGNVLRELCSSYDFAIGLDKFSDSFANPALLAKSALRQARVRLTSKRGKRNLRDDELKKFLQWLPGSVFTPTQKNILRFTLWTGCRTGEVCGAKWKDIDLDKGTWHLLDTKMGNEQIVQLPTQAIAFLEQLKLITGDYPFPSQKTGKPIQQKSLTEQAWHLRKSNRMLDIEHWTPHDLRRTVRTGLSRLGCPNEVAEAVLGHTAGGIVAIYNLNTYGKECRLWLQKWADHLDSLLKISEGK